MFRIIFTSQGKGYELYARKINQGEMYGFVEIEEIVFGERTNLVVDPSEEALRREFSGIKKMLIPFHSISRIDEVEKEGPGKVIALNGEESVVPPVGMFPSDKSE
ncbi:MAG: DUF1820 domain-containing protein [Desulfuromonas sp.]|nr:MAG: DUF1820 domain-containing protein [Desulfuromonas sp.]